MVFFLESNTTGDKPRGSQESHAEADVSRVMQENHGDKPVAQLLRAEHVPDIISACPELLAPAGGMATALRCRGLIVPCGTYAYPRRRALVPA